MLYIMGRHFKPSPSERKAKRKQKKRRRQGSPIRHSKLNIWVFRLKPKPTDTVKTYTVSLDVKVDPNVFHERLSELIPDVIVKADDPKAPASYFIVVLAQPTTLRDIYSKTAQALKGLI